MTRVQNVLNIFLGICFEIFFALCLVAGAFLLSFAISFFYFKR